MCDGSNHTQAVGWNCNLNIQFLSKCDFNVRRASQVAKSLTEF